MDKDHLVAEMEKLTLSQKATLRKLVGSVRPQKDVLRVTRFDAASTVFVRRDGQKMSLRLTPRGRVLESNQWSA
jgi:hypothetical protein